MSDPSDDHGRDRDDRQKPPRFRRPQHGTFDPPRPWDGSGDDDDAAWREAERGLEADDPDDGDVPA